jgi:hypothetical protein
MESKSICGVCGVALGEHEMPCKNCSSSTKPAGNKRPALGDGFWISALIGLITSYFIGGFAIFGDAGSTTPQLAATVVVGGVATQIGSWYFGQALIRRGHRVLAWLLLATPFIFVGVPIMIVCELIASFV